MQPVQLQAAVGRAASHRGQALPYLTQMHSDVGLIKSTIANVRAAIGHVGAAAEQSPKLDRWATPQAYIRRRIVCQIPPNSASHTRRSRAASAI